MVMMVADMIILNILYIICCIPIVTIGAAQAGMFTGLRVLLDPEDDRSVAKSFFRGFANGFGKVSILSTIMLAILAVLGLLLSNSLVYYFAGGSNLSVILCIVAMSIVYCIHSILAPFHATFDCTPKLLIRNCFLVAMAHPIQSILSATLILLPVVILLVWPQVLLAGMIAFCALYYSVAYLLIFTLWKKPFQRLKDNFYNAQKEAEETKEETIESESDSESYTEE